MTYKEKRLPYEFDYETKQEALRRSPVCEGCGKPETKEDPFVVHHKIAIWFALENPCLIPEVLRSIQNAQTLHRSCHHKLHRQESRKYYQEVVPVVVSAWLTAKVDHSKDDWRKERCCNP